MFAYALASKPCSEATNKDYFISRGLCFGSFANQTFRARIYPKELDKAVCKICNLLYNKWS